MERGKQQPTLGAGILNIIWNTSGKLPPTQLRNFLNQARGRKKIMQIAGYFTSNIPALVDQLHEVEANYYKQGKRGVKIDKDMEFIRRLCMRLERDSLADHHGSNKEYDFQEYHEKNVYQPSFSGAKKREVFQSTSVYKQTSNEVAKKPSSAGGTGSLSTGVINIIFNIGGELPPIQLRDFLNQVRGREIAFWQEIASRFTTNVPALVNQLQRAETNYYNEGRRGIGMDEDIAFIRRLRKQLQSESGRNLYAINDISEQYYKQDAYQPLFSGERKTDMFASTSSYKHTPTKAVKKQFGGKTTNLSSGTVKIISSTTGLLPSFQLCEFLKLVRGKKKAIEIAGQFTANIPALVNQLQKVEANYYQLGKKGVRMNRDIDFIRRLHKRLQSKRNEGYVIEEFSTETISREEYSEEDSTEEYSENSTEDDWEDFE